MRIYITRHPITEEIEQGIVQGKEIGTVSIQGYLQVKDFVEQLPELSFEKIISSDAKRCKQMVEQIIKKTTYPVEYIGLIDEKDYGIWEGKQSKDAIKIVEGPEESWYYEGGESLLDLRNRAGKFKNYLLETSLENADLLIVSHSIFLSLLVGVFLGDDIITSREKYLMDHCAITTIDYDRLSQKFRLKLFNDQRHLSA